MALSKITLELNKKTLEIGKKLSLNNKILKSDIDALKDLNFNHYFSKVNGLGTGITGSFKKNLRDFSDAKVAKMMNEMNTISKVDLLTKLEKSLEGLMARYNQDWLEAEANIIEGKVMGVKQWEGYMETFKDNKNATLTYVTANDDKVREEHEALDGFTAAVDDPIWMTIDPPEWDWNCRCTLVLNQDEDIVDNSEDYGDVLNYGGSDDIADNAYYTGKIFSEEHGYFQ